MTKTLEELKEQVSLVEYLENQGYELKKVGVNTLSIAPCPICSDGNNHFRINAGGNYYNTFNGCGKSGSLIDWFIEVDGMSMNEAIDKLYSLAGEERPTRGDGYTQGKESVSLTNEKKTPSQPQLDAQPQPNNELDFTDYITKAHNATIENDDLRRLLIDFCFERGISTQQIRENKISVIDWYNKETGAKYKRVVLPVWKGGKVVWHTRRALDAPEGEVRFMDVSGVSKSEAIFNVDYLEQRHDQPIFLTESIIDAMNLETLGYKAIAINSTTNLDNFMERFGRSKARNTFLIAAFDNDEAGRKGAKKLIELGYHSIKKPCIKSKVNNKGVLEDVTDINDWFLDSFKTSQKAPQDDLSDLGIKVSIDRQMALRGRTDNLESYLEFDFLSEIDELSIYKDKKTGFDNLDKKMNGVQPGLYVVGGVSSVGKTTFVHQLVDQMAELGDHVLYFSLEQSRLEMVTKSLARTMANIDFKDAYGSISIRKGKKTPLLTKAITEYKKYAGRVNIYEGNFKTNVVFIENYVKRYMAQNNVNPIVVVDYLQIMPPIDDNFNDRGKIDENVKVLKALSSESKIPVFLISSFNRTSYQSPSTFESFKESGGIEYTADVMWALDFAIVHDKDFQKEKVAAIKNKLLNDFKEKQPREIVLTCLKNRNGNLFKTRFTYHSNLDLYRSNEGLGDFRSGKQKGIASDDTNIKLDLGREEYEEVDMEGAGGLVQIVKKKKTF